MNWFAKVWFILSTLFAGNVFATAPPPKLQTNLSVNQIILNSDETATHIASSISPPLQPNTSYGNVSEQTATLQTNVLSTCGDPNTANEFSLASILYDYTNNNCLQISADGYYNLTVEIGVCGANSGISSGYSSQRFQVYDLYNPANCSTGTGGCVGIWNMWSSTWYDIATNSFSLSTSGFNRANDLVSQAFTPLSMLFKKSELANSRFKSAYNNLYLRSNAVGQPLRTATTPDLDTIWGLECSTGAQPPPPPPSPPPRHPSL